MYFIIDPDAPLHKVWNHRLGAFAIDFDAYYDRDFAYSNYEYAQKRADRIMAERDMNSISVVDRNGLFSWLDLKDSTK